MGYLEDSVREFVIAARKWNVKIFGNIMQMKRKLLAHIGSVQRCLDNYWSKKLVDLEKEPQIELEEVLDNEELLWKQKSRNDWLMLGDRNTNYFHSQVNKRKRRNKIRALKLDDENWCYYEDRVKDEAVGFFKHLYY